MPASLYEGENGTWHFPSSPRSLPAPLLQPTEDPASIHFGTSGPPFVTTDTIPLLSPLVSCLHSMASSRSHAFTPSFRQLTVRNKRNPFDQGHQSGSSQSNTVRLQVGMDFGTVTSSVCYDAVSDFTSLPESAPARHLVYDPNDTCNHRIPSVAAVVADIDSDGHKKMILMFGDNTYSKFAGHVLCTIKLMKLATLPAYHGASDDWLMRKTFAELKAQHEDAIRKIQWEALTSRLYTQDPLTGEFNCCTVNSVEDVIALFLKFLWRLTTRHCVETYAITAENVKKVFQEDVDVAVSVPAIGHDNSILDTYLQLLDNAGYPQSTCILFEAKSAKLFHITTELRQRHVGLDQVQRLSASVVVDIGSGTTDICCVRPSAISNATITLGEASIGISSADGSLRINEVFKEHLRTQVPGGVLQLLSGCKWTESDVLEAFAADFEIKKRYAGTDPQVCRIIPNFDTVCRFNHFRCDSFYTDEVGLVLEPGTIQRIFEDWLRNIFHLVDEQLGDLRSRYPGIRSIKIDLKGEGSLPPYVLAAFKGRYSQEGVNVHLMEFGGNPAVAQGNFLTLVTQKMVKRKLARAAFGTRLDTATSFRLLGHVDTIHWLVKQDEDLDDPNQQLFNKRMLVLKNPVFPLTIKLDIMSDTDYGSLENEGEIQIELETLERCGFQLERCPHGVTVLKLEHSVQIRLRGLLAWLVMIVPHSGLFDSMNRDRSLDVMNFCQIKIQKHAARMDEIES